MRYCPFFSFSFSFFFLPPFLSFLFFRFIEAERLLIRIHCVFALSTSPIHLFNLFCFQEHDLLKIIVLISFPWHDTQRMHHLSVIPSLYEPKCVQQTNHNTNNRALTYTTYWTRLKIIQYWYILLILAWATLTSLRRSDYKVGIIYHTVHRDKNVVSLCEETCKQISLITAFNISMAVMITSIKVIFG